METKLIGLGGISYIMMKRQKQEHTRKRKKVGKRKTFNKHSFSYIYSMIHLFATIDELLLLFLIKCIYFVNKIISD